MTHAATLRRAVTLLARLGAVRTDWTLEEVRELFALPFADLMFHAQRVHRANFDPNEVQVSTLLSIKTGACPEDCAYCSQSIRFETGLKSEPLMDVEDVLAKARIARANGATRFCMGAAYRSPKPKQLAQIAEMIKGVRALGMETCVTLGMLTRRAGARAEGRRASTTTTTISTRRRLTTAKSSRRAPTRIGSTRCRPCATPASTSAAAAFSAWARTSWIARSCCTRSRRCRSIRRACRSISWCRCPARRCTAREKPDPLDFVRMIAVARLLMPRVARAPVGRPLAT